MIPPLLGSWAVPCVCVAFSLAVPAEEHTGKLYSENVFGFSLAKENLEELKTLKNKSECW